MDSIIKKLEELASLGKVEDLHDFASKNDTSIINWHSTFVLASKGGHVNIMKYIMSSESINKEYIYKIGGYSALQHAVIQKNTEMVDLLLSDSNFELKKEENFYALCSFDSVENLDFYLKVMPDKFSFQQGIVSAIESDQVGTLRLLIKESGTKNKDSIFKKAFVMESNAVLAYLIHEEKFQLSEKVNHWLNESRKSALREKIKEDMRIRDLHDKLDNALDAKPVKSIKIKV